MNYSRSDIGIFWDIENCGVFKEFSNHADIYNNIKKALTDIGYLGVTSFWIYGDMERVSKSVRTAFETWEKNEIPDVTIRDIRTKTKGNDIADKKLIFDMRVWASKHPAPAIILLIAGDKDYVSVVNKFFFENYAIFVANLEHKGRKPLKNHMFDIAHVVWDWEALIEGNAPHIHRPTNIDNISINDIRNGIIFLKNNSIYTTKEYIVNAIRFHCEKPYPEEVVFVALKSAVAKGELFRCKVQNLEDIEVYEFTDGEAAMYSSHVSPKKKDQLEKYISTEAGRNLKESCSTTEKRICKFQFGMEIINSSNLDMSLQDVLEILDTLEI